MWQVEAQNGEAQSGLGDPRRMLRNVHGEVISSKPGHQFVEQDVIARRDGGAEGLGKITREIERDAPLIPAEDDEG